MLAAVLMTGHRGREGSSSCLRELLQEWWRGAEGWPGWWSWRWGEEDRLRL